MTKSKKSLKGKIPSRRKFFKTAAKVLNDADKEDEAFYMEQMVEWLQSGKPLPTSEESIIKALGL